MELPADLRVPGVGTAIVVGAIALPLVGLAWVYFAVSGASLAIVKAIAVVIALLALVAVGIVAHALVTT